MAIIQISKIQVRQGNLIDIPQLSPGEFGWADDQRRLFIGNDANRPGDPPPSVPNNTEVLTEYSPISGTNIVGNITAGGANGDVQFNSNGVIAGSSAITFTPTQRYNPNGYYTDGYIVDMQNSDFYVLNDSNLHIGVANLKLGGGQDGYFLQTDGTGNLSWAAGSGGGGNGTPGGSNTQVQFNNNGTFGASANFTFNTTTNTMAVSNCMVGVQAVPGILDSTVRIGPGYISVGNTPGNPLTGSGEVWAIRLQATHADLGEYYHSDEHYESGTVLDFGGETEVTISTQDMSQRVAGVVSTDPAYVMNGAIKDDIKSVIVALQGRVPTKVIGYVHKGDMMVSAGNGYARSESEPVIGSVIGKALENKDYAEAGVIEVVIGRL